MFDFGDELIIDSYRIPWLIWIQLVVMILLILLLYSLSSSPSDLSLLSSASAPATDPSTSSAPNRPSLPTPTATATAAAATLLHSKQAIGNQVKETGTSRGARAGKEDIRKRDDVGSSSKDVGHGLIYGESYHPCNFLDLAKQAFLKCLGLDSSPDNPSRRKHGKDG